MTSALRQRAHESPGFNDDLAQRLSLNPAAACSTEFERLGALESMRSICAVPFDSEKSEHIRTLKDIWHAAFPDEVFTLPSERWKDIGFQGTDPRTDLRGAGFLGLSHLNALLQQHGLGLGSISDDLPSELVCLPLSIASVNVTAMLLSYLQLSPNLTCAFLPGGRVECGHDALHGFLSLGWEGSSAGGGADDDATADMLDQQRHEFAAAVRRLQFALQAMHALLMLHLGRTWKAMTEQPETTLMDFPKALRATYAHMQRALRACGALPWRLERLTALLEQETDSASANLSAAAATISESIGTSINDCVVQPTAWAITGVGNATVALFWAVVGICYSVPPPDYDDTHAGRGGGSSAGHAKRQ